MTLEIIEGDCVDVMKRMPENSIDLVVTSPPFNLGIKYDVYEDRLGWGDYYNWCHTWLYEIYRVLKPDGRLCLNHYLSCGTAENRSAPLMRLECISEHIGFKHHGFALLTDSSTVKRCAWGSWLSASAPYISSPYEGILILYKRDWKRRSKGESTVTKKEFMESTLGIWKLPTARRENGVPVFHVNLPLRCISLFTYKGDTVLDPFSGMGTTGVACRISGRNYIGIELSGEYCKESRGRLGI